MGGPIKKIDDLMVYQLAYQLAMEVFEMTKRFPREETYSLTDQIRRSSRSAVINIREGYAKRRYHQVNAMLFSLMKRWENRNQTVEAGK